MKKHAIREITLTDHMEVRGEQCVYCRGPVKPKRYKDGRTRGYDHFIPLNVLGYAREQTSTPIWNFLLPSCKRCNTLGGSYLFITMNEKLNFIRDKASLPYAFLPEFLRPITCPQTLLNMIKPLNELSLAEGYIIIMPRFIDGSWETSQNAEMLLCARDKWLRDRGTGPKLSVEHIPDWPLNECEFE